MLADFDAGLIDITDVPELANRVNCTANPSCDQNNANYYVTNGQAELGEEQIDISHQVSFLNLALWCSRIPFTCTAGQGSPGFAPQVPTVTLVSDATTVCDATHFQLVVVLKNFEENLAVIADPNEVITATPVAGIASSRQSATGTYDLGCLSGIPPGYALTTLVYGDGGTVTPASATPPTYVSLPAKVSIATSAGGTGVVCANNLKCTVNFNVDYNSPSNKEPTVASIHIARALGHLVDKPNFRNLPVLNGRAVCDDIWASPSQGIMNSVGDGTTACAATNNGVPSTEVSAATIAAECTQDLASSSLAGFAPISPCTPVSLYHLASNSIHGAATCATNSAGVQIPTATCFPSFGGSATVTILAETGYAGSVDLTAACDQLLLAGFTMATGGTCADVAVGNVVGGVTAHLSNGGQKLAYLIRLPGAFPARPRYGMISADEIQFLFGTGAPNGGTICYGFLQPAVGPGATCSAASPSAPTLYSIGQVGNDVFQSSNRWNLYTGAQSHGSTPDAILYNLHSQFGGSSTTGFSCGGPLADFPGDYDVQCDPVLDTQAFAGEFSPSFGASFALFQNTATLAATRGVLATIFSNVNKYVALNAWNTEHLVPGTQSSLAPGFGVGFEASGSGSYQTLLNMRPSGAVTSGAFQAGGGQAGLIRRSNTGAGTLHENPFQANTVWEVDLIAGIFDTMLAINPNTGGSNLQLIDWMTKSHSSSFDSASGHNTQIWNLRNDICWHDTTPTSPGVPCDRPVTADDVCFSVLMARDGPARYLSAVQDVLTCTYPDAQTVVVVHSGLSAFQDINIGGIYILPAHLWGTACGWAAGPHDSSHEPNVPYNSVTGVGVIAAPCSRATFDPMALTFNGSPFNAGTLPPNVSGLMVGSGPYMCIVPAHNGAGPAAGKIGGSCAIDPATGLLQGQALAVGHVQVETKFQSYMRCCDNQQGSNLQSLSWADSTKIGKVTIVAASALSFVYGTNDPYFSHPLFGTAGIVGIGQAAFMANAFDSGTIAPCVSFSCPGPPNEPTPAAVLLGPDPTLDRYSYQLTGSSTGPCLYIQDGAVSSVTGQLVTCGTSAAVTTTGGATVTCTIAAFLAGPGGGEGAQVAGTVGINANGKMTCTPGSALVVGGWYHARFFSDQPPPTHQIGDYVFKA